jgi:hypothetical protein
MARQIVMDHTGDSRHEFDLADAVAVAEAEKHFKELTGAGFTAAKRLGEGKSELVKSFDPTGRDAVHTAANWRMTTFLFLLFASALILIFGVGLGYAAAVLTGLANASRAPREQAELWDSRRQSRLVRRRAGPQRGALRHLFLTRSYRASERANPVDLPAP